MLARMFAHQEEGVAPRWRNYENQLIFEEWHPQKVLFLMDVFLPSCKDESGAYLLDRSPRYFEPLLNYLRTGSLIIDPNVSRFITFIISSLLYCTTILSSLA